MASYQITITPSRRAAVRYIQQVRRAFQRAFSDEAAATGLTQAQVANRIGVNRSVVHRELRGEANLTQGRVGELAWAMGYKPVFSLEKIGFGDGVNEDQDAAQPPAPRPDRANGGVVIYAVPELLDA